MFTQFNHTKFMPRLTEAKKAQVIALREANLSWNTVVAELKIPKSTARSVWTKYNNNLYFPQ